ncbi:MAG: ABC transporter ATP-binding protein [Candidatus Lambdaproteobacteria bacterium RIFOXYD1_FULL_56_27]|uniref:ABC transporter ATP-binding protein n=1 Tax=Candidatus Lambdaproteobacteria bacterium RIFOXYD2_FULL_56_26 TaxID=1817773 RepID=A0A1F6H319_9PROT|nr:MAG: ABC transporter ATP-binding protein [Candidatus Lambdaproteobacteria bacterium RIFOXYD2_FULL_56_26]OGH05408.1 MAG: ABC transporter ATP-binding protein [Candidatus Lambdaproteobacteria bacterium RIFOXYC1_FULL_56_13]OGH09252.1 MAG: ABC transporter ATP-binding protein [Candidatus Lambdaproteobacteria bacterium RIFOXYD1_FULL_56_27]
MASLVFLLAQVYRHKFTYLAGILAIFATNWMAVTIPGYLQRAVDLLSLGTGGLGEKKADLAHALGMILMLALAVILARTLSRVLFFNPARTIEFEVKQELFDKLTHLEKNYYDQTDTGSIISRLQNDITGLRLLCGFGVMQVFNILTSLSLTPYKMWSLSPSLTMYCVLPLILSFGLVKLGIGLIVQHSKNRQSFLQAISGFIVSALSGVDVVKGFGLEKWTTKRFQEQNLSLVDETLRISLVRSFMMPVLNNLEHILKVLVLLVGGLAVINGEFTIGQLTEFIAYAGLLTHPIMGLGWLSTLYQQGLVGIESLKTILRQETPKKHLPRLAEPEKDHLFRSGLTVKGLTYRYPGAEQPVIQDLHFELKPHQSLGVLGKIGAGKTTLVNCLNGYLQIEPGQVFLGDKDLTALNPKDLRQRVRTVTQDIFLFSQTVTQNILFGSHPTETPNLDDLIYKSALSEEVSRFPLKMETLVGERGIMLSGGQKQRISLARALAAPCDLLILDNVLSAVDYETERFLLEQILKRETAQSLMIVSHRVRALEGADLILVLDQGRIVQAGVHGDLVNQPGIYKEIWELQNQGDRG